MYLKRLEINGFKSFANRTEFLFAPGITAVVGPNGSGKSNVTDSIRWVLGEQSAKSLRGSKMEDVIFAGSSTRKPVGFCEVSITFDNADRKLFLDYGEVTVTRRVYRSGESEYLLNKQACRLKDIHELFMDTGIGKEAYSLIGQGRIDEILSTKSEDRRMIFEEAAGIVKYKTRKKEAEQKLTSTEENLSRVHDLIHELDTQMAPLEEQVKKAKLWKETKETLKKYEIALYVQQIEELQERWQKTTERIAAEKEKQIELQTKCQQKEVSFEKLKYQLDDQERTWEQTQQKMLVASEALEKAEGTQNVVRERMKQQQLQQKARHERMEQMEWEAKQTLENQRKIRSQWEQKQQELKEIHQKLEGLQHQSMASDSMDQTKLTQLKEQLQQMEHIEIQKSQQIIHLQEQLSQIEEEISRWKEIGEQKEKDLVQRKEKDHEFKKKQTHFQEQKQALRMQSEQNQEQLHKLAQQSSDLQQKIHKSEQVMERIRSRIEFLQEMKSSREGYYRGVKKLLQSRDQGNPKLQGIAGAVAELITVPSEYEVAVETALGSSLQYLIVEDEQVARNAIQFLKDHHLGQATFLPKNVIQSRLIPQKELQKCDQQGLQYHVASQFVEIPKPYKHVIEFLLGRVLVVNTLEEANRCARVLNHRYRIVTLEGDMVHPGGSMSGGSRKRQSNHLLGRDRQFQMLSDELEQEQKKWQQLHTKQKEIQQLKNQLQQKKEQLLQSDESLQEKQQKLQQVLYENEKQLLRDQDQYHESVQKIEDWKRKRKDVLHRLENLNTQQDELKQQLASTQAQIDEYEQKFADHISKQNQDNEQMMELKVLVAKIQQELIHLEQDLARLKQEYQKIVQQKETLLQEIHQVEAQLKEDQTHLETLEQEMMEHQKRKSLLKQQLVQEKAQREKTIQQRDQEEQEIRSIQKTLKELETLLHEQELMANRLDVELKHLLNKLAEEYEISFERAKKDFPPIENGMEKQVRKLKRKLNQLGEVNLGSIEEHQRLNDRLQFLKSQEADLLEAKQSLYQMIEQIEAEMSKRFFEVFEAIRQEFTFVFTKMFGGGKADLHLTDPDRVLDTGIEIVAQPPGKRPQHLSLLSGGERALTAIALLFAVIRVKPVPFCVLDEVDAALDEVNLTRFTRYMKQSSEETQFIIITHRKQTMTGADVLYGITMAESGVSKLVSAKLEDWEQSKVAATVLKEET